MEMADGGRPGQGSNAGSLNQVPEARTDHTFVRYKNRFYVYGGRDEVQIFKDIHEYSIVSNQWKQIFHHSDSDSDTVHRIMLSYEEESPTAMLDHVAFVSEPNIRFGHTAIVHKSLMYVFGGWDGTETLDHLNAYDLEKNVWLEFQGMKGSIKGRYRHSACATQSSMYIFGGIDQNQERFNDINEFNFDSQTWTRVLATGFSPSTRTFHEALMYKGVMYIFGGFDGMKRNDIYRILFDEEEKKRNLQEYEMRQMARSFSLINSSMDDINEGSVEAQLHQSYYFSSQGMGDASSNIVGGNMVQHSLVPITMSGSTTQKQNEKLKPQFTNEYFMNMQIGKWKKIMPIDSCNFTPRTGHDCILVKDKIYLFGGTDDDDRKNDLHMYDIYLNKWSLLPSKGKVPLPRSGAKGVSYDNKLYFFGGYQKKSGNFYKDLFYYDLAKEQWYDVGALQSGEMPSQRTDHSVVLWDGRLYVYGGYDGKKRFGDLFKCCIKNKKYKWKEIQSEGIQPLNRFGHSAVVYQNSMFIFGGWNGHDTMNDIFQYSFLSNYWYEIHRTNGSPP